MRERNTASVFVGIFLLLILAEITTTMDKVAGLFLYFVALFISILYVSLVKRDMYIISLTLPPLLRILDLSMPTFFPYTIYFFPFVYLPVFPSVYMAVKALDLKAEDLGFSLKAWYLLLPAGVLIGYLLSYPEYMILHPNALIPDFSLKSFVTLFIVMYIFAAFVEELVFRSVLQSTLEKKFGLRRGLLLASIMFAVMHAGFGCGEIAYALFTGLLIGFLFQKTRSLPLVVMIHGTINVMVFGLFHVESMANLFSLKDITLPWF